MNKNKREQKKSGAVGGGDERAARVEELLRSEDLFERAMKHADSPALMEELQKLSPEEAAMFVLLVERQIKKRRIELIGYAVGLFCLLGGMLFALYLYATREPGEFMGWAFLIPFLLVGAVFLIFGHLARRS